MPKYRIEIRVEADNIESIPDALNKISITDLANLHKVLSICDEDTNMWIDFSEIFES